MGGAASVLKGGLIGGLANGVFNTVRPIVSSVIDPIPVVGTVGNVLLDTVGGILGKRSADQAAIGM